MSTSPSSARKFLDNYLVEPFLHALYSVCDILCPGTILISVVILNMVPHRLLYLRTRHLRQHMLVRLFYTVFTIMTSH